MELLMLKLIYLQTLLILCTGKMIRYTVFSKRNATFLKLPFFWRRVYTSESGVIHHIDKAHGNNLLKTSYADFS